MVILAHFLQDGEPVEFETEEDDSGRLRAVTVTGPNGGPVQGRPRQAFNDYGGRGGGGGNYGGRGGGGGFDSEHDFGGGNDDDMWKPRE